jgi:hypothetical protein
MERFPTYLRDVGARNSLSKRLECIAGVFVQHARSVVLGRESTSNLADSSSVQSSSRPLFEMDMNHLGLTPDRGSPTVPPETGQLELGGFDGDLKTFMDNFDCDDMFDWLSWEGQAPAGGMDNSAGCASTNKSR